MTTMTPSTQHGQKAYASCHGAHHSGSGVIGTCDACHASVIKIDQPCGKVPVGTLVEMVHVGSYGARSYYCWNRHHCDPAMVEAVSAERAALIASGEIVKGATVEVVKGRKVPVGTTGTVFWMGEDDWGKARVGLRTPDGQSHFTAASNVRTVL